MNKVYPYNWLYVIIYAGLWICLFVYTCFFSSVSLTFFGFYMFGFWTFMQLVMLNKVEVPEHHIKINKIFRKELNISHTNVRSYDVIRTWLSKEVREVILTLNEGPQVSLTPSGTQNFPELLEWLESNFKNWQTVDAESPYS